MDVLQGSWNLVLPDPSNKSQDIQLPLNLKYMAILSNYISSIAWDICVFCKVFIVYLQFKGNWASWILPGNIS